MYMYVYLTVKDRAVHCNYSWNKHHLHSPALAASSAEIALVTADSHVSSLTDAPHPTTSHVMRTCSHVTRIYTINSAAIMMSRTTTHVWWTVSLCTMTEWCPLPAHWSRTTVHCILVQSTTTTSVHKGHRHHVTTAHAQCTVRWLSVDRLTQTDRRHGATAVVKCPRSQWWDGMVARMGRAVSTWWWTAV